MSNIELVKEFTNNPPFFEEIANKYSYIIDFIGNGLSNKAEWIGVDTRYTEVIEFLDGHNFIVEYPDSYRYCIIKLTPQYPTPSLDEKDLIEDAAVCGDSDI